MLDTTPAPPARLLAQMRATVSTKAKKLPDHLAFRVADALARRPGMTAAKAEAASDPLQRAYEAAQSAKMATDELFEILERMIGEIPEGEEEVDATALLENGLNLLSERYAAKGDNVPMVGRPTDRTAGGAISVGHSWDEGDGFRAKMVAGLVARLDPRKATRMGRDAAKMTIPEIAMQVCRMQGLRPFDEADAVRMATHSTSDFPLILEDSMANGGMSPLTGG